MHLWDLVRDKRRGKGFVFRRKLVRERWVPTWYMVLCSYQQIANESSVVLTFLTRTGKSDRHTGPTGRAESLTLGQLKVRTCQRTWRRTRTQSLRDRGLPSKQYLSVVVTNIEDTKFLCFPRSQYELVKLHRALEAILNMERVHERLLCVTAGTGLMSAFTDYKRGRRENLCH